MSWSISSIRAEDPNAVEAAVEDAISDGIDYRPMFVTKEHRNQAWAAVEAVRALWPTVVRPGDTAAITLAGHANEGLNPEPGWGDSMVGVTISQVIADGE